MRDNCFICSRASYDFEHHGMVMNFATSILIADWSIISEVTNFHWRENTTLMLERCNAAYTYEKALISSQLL